MSVKITHHFSVYIERMHYEIQDQNSDKMLGISPIELETI